MSRDIQSIIDDFRHGLRATAGDPFERRIGAELKFPLVTLDGAPVSRGVVDRLWSYLVDGAGWRADRDHDEGPLIGACIAGERNDTVASCETGYCKTEFSLAHVGDLHRLARATEELVALLEPFATQEQVRFLAYGIHPLAEPGRDLLMRKERAGFWDRAMPAHDRIPDEQGDDVHLFTVNAGSHVHVAVREDEAVPAVDVLCALTGAQIALCAHSSVWRGAIDPEHLAVSEVVWDWWRHARGRCGVPVQPFGDVDGYVRAITDLAPVYAKRPEGPVLLTDYARFIDYFAATEATGRDLDGRPVPLTPTDADLAKHNSCYWYDARISQYYTIENRACDQQPPGEQLIPAALTLGLVESLEEARALVATHPWATWRASRDAAIRDGLAARVDDLSLADVAAQVVDLAEAGLRRRDRGEEVYLEPLRGRLAAATNPACAARDLVDRNGLRALVAARDLHTYLERP